MGGPLAPRSQAASLIDFTDNHPDGGTFFYLGDTKVHYVSWSQTTSSVNTAIGVIVARNEEGLEGTAWLMPYIGGLASPQNVIATVNFTAPDISYDDRLDLTNAPYTTLFTGLSLNPGTYYLVLQGPDGDFDNPFDWLGDHSGVEINTAAGFTVGTGGSTNAPAPFAPASVFTDHDSGKYPFYRVVGDTVPAPATLLLLGSGLLGLAGWRRFRKG